jgi:hypothetical protein
MQPFRSVLAAKEVFAPRVTIKLLVAFPITRDTAAFMSDVAMQLNLDVVQTIQIALWDTMTHSARMTIASDADLRAGNADAGAMAACLAESLSNERLAMISIVSRALFPKLKPLHDQTVLVQSHEDLLRNFPALLTSLLSQISCKGNLVAAMERMCSDGHSRAHPSVASITVKCSVREASAVVLLVAQIVSKMRTALNDAQIDSVVVTLADWSLQLPALVVPLYSACGAAEDEFMSLVTVLHETQVLALSTALACNVSLFAKRLQEGLSTLPMPGPFYEGSACNTAITECGSILYAFADLLALTRPVANPPREAGLRCEHVFRIVRGMSESSGYSDVMPFLQEQFRSLFLRGWEIQASALDHGSIRPLLYVAFSWLMHSEDGTGQAWGKGPEANVWGKVLECLSRGSCRSRELFWLCVAYSVPEKISVGCLERVHELVRNELNCVPVNAMVEVLKSVGHTGVDGLSNDHVFVVGMAFLKVWHCPS